MYKESYFLSILPGMRHSSPTASRSFNKRKTPGFPQKTGRIIPANANRPPHYNAYPSTRPRVKVRSRYPFPAKSV